MADDQKVTLVHPDQPGVEYRCHPDAVEAWAAVGWKKATVKKEKANG